MRTAFRSRRERCGSRGGVGERKDRLIADPALIQHWLHRRSGLPLQKGFHGVAREVDGRIVAAFGYDYFQGSSCCLHTATDYPWGYNRALLTKAFKVPFEQWGYNCLISIIQSGNLSSLNMSRRLGFTEFAVLPGAHPSGGLHFGVMYRDDCRWLLPHEGWNEWRRRKRT